MGLSAEGLEDHTSQAHDHTEEKLWHESRIDSFTMGGEHPKKQDKQKAKRARDYLQAREVLMVVQAHKRKVQHFANMKSKWSKKAWGKQSNHWGAPVSERVPKQPDNLTISTTQAVVLQGVSQSQSIRGMACWLPT